MTEPKLICNQAKCLKCGDIIISHHRHDFKSCKCGLLSVDGGNDYTRRLFRDRNDFEELSVYSDAEYSIIRQNIYRGSRGVDGKQPLTWIKLCDIDDSYLDNLIKYQEDNGYTESIYYEIYLKEREYRGLTN